MTQLIDSMAKGKAKAEVFSETGKPRYVRCQSFSYAMDAVMWNDAIRIAVITAENRNTAEAIIAKRSSDHYLLVRKVGKHITAIELDLRGLMQVLPDFWDRMVAVCVDESRTPAPAYYKSFLTEDAHQSKLERG